MRREPDLIYQLLAYVEEKTNGPVEVPTLRCYTHHQVHNHVRLCVEAGYIETDKPGWFDGLLYYPAIHRLTWLGHEALDQMRRDRGH